jgi:glycosyltransferase involved in cell wall biosynthesis
MVASTAASQFDASAHHRRQLRAHRLAEDYLSQQAVLGYSNPPWAQPVPIARGNLRVESDAVPIRISIITATLNRRALLRRAIESVVAQGLEGVEHIVVDGVSTDGTIQMLADYSHLTVISEPDRCLYEAWNKGLRRASGKLICILNSDDEIPAGAFAHVRAAFAAQPDIDMISGAVEIQCTDTEGSIKTRVIDDARILALREQDVGPGTPLINGRYLTPELIARVGPFDERYRLVSDRDFLLRVLSISPSNAIVPVPLYRYHIHDGSLTLSGSGVVARRLSAESFAAARNGLVEGATEKVRAAYARWHAWAAGYLFAILAREGHFRAAALLAADAFRRDPAWLLRLPAPVVRHVLERGARRGRPIGSVPVTANSDPG